MDLNLDLVIFSSFLIINLLVGLFYGRGVTSIGEYAIGKRNFSTGTIVATLVATWIGAGFFTYTLVETYRKGLYFLIPTLGDSLVFILLGYVLAPRMGEFLGKLSIAEAMNDLFKLVKKLGGRMIYFRPVIVNDQAYPITEATITRLEKYSKQYQLPYWANQNKTLPRNYKKCHQMFHFPVFCADGKIYICCEGKGNPQFELTNWDTDDFRDAWLNQRHYEIYNKTRVEFCAPCRPNISNIKIQNILNNPKDIETLYL
jgi:hypothetical protein